MYSNRGAVTRADSPAASGRVARAAANGVIAAYSLSLMAGDGSLSCR
jgi:hypothetical protein